VDPSAAAERIKSWAREAGFELAGVAALSPAATGEAYRRWLARGDHAGMAYLERNVGLRLDPRGLLEGARSALVVGRRYAPAGPPPGGDLWPRVARYARGEDYHRTMRDRLRGVAAAIEERWPGTRTRVCVDTAPLLERELAARAGLGAVGKNTNLLSPEIGSWFLLGEVLTTLELPSDPPVADLCGRCTRCLDACPTGALPEPYRLDAGRCISYWTIEHRGEIPAAIRPAVGEWVFGCDVCQEVCPWNRPDGETRAGAEFEPSPARRELDLVGLLEIDEPEYLERFRGSALRRARRDGLRRNAALALAGRGDAASRAALCRAAADPAPEVAGAAAWAAARSAPTGGPQD
jgi:epoxyqueuosine reductase